MTEEAIHHLIDIGKLRNSELEFRRLPMEVEAELMSKIRLGQFDEIHMSPLNKISDNIGLMASDPIKQCTFLAVSGIALFSRAAIDGGAAPDDSFDLSDALIFAVSYGTTVEEIYAIYQLAAVMFAKLVHKQLAQKHSVQVEHTLNYISRNIYHKITLEELAEYTQLSPNYLCALFSNEMKISLHNYIQREKITISCNLLKYSDRSVSDIASYMGFQTQSNFASVFRKWEHMSPSQYREKNAREVF